VHCGDRKSNILLAISQPSPAGLPVTNNLGNANLLKVRLSAYRAVNSLRLGQKTRLHLEQWSLVRPRRGLQPRRETL
jgi:hypothetical protein